MEMQEKDRKLREAVDRLHTCFHHYAPTSAFWQTVRAESVDNLLDMLVDEQHPRVAQKGVLRW